LRDRLLSLPRAAELAKREKPNATLKELRDALGGPGVSDEELILRYVMKGEQEIRAMRAAGGPKRYFSGELPLIALLRRLQNCSNVRFVSLQRGAERLRLQNQSAA
jgi:oxaloacetate decarboxylase alpha subunit